MLTFRAIAKASRLPWSSVRVQAEGTLDRVERVTRFVGVRLLVELVLPTCGDPEKGRKLLEKAEHGCLVTNSLAREVGLEASVSVSG